MSELRKGDILEYHQLKAQVEQGHEIIIQVVIGGFLRRRTATSNFCGKIRKVTIMPPPILYHEHSPQVL